MLSVAMNNRLKELAEKLIRSPLRLITALFPIKFVPLVGKTYFQGLYLLFGSISLIRKPSWKKELIPLFLLAIYAIFLGFYYFFTNNQSTSLLRAIQFLLLLYTCQAMAEILKSADWSKLFKFWAIATVALYTIEITFTKPVGGRSFMFIERYLLLVGEPNFSALFFTSLTAISLVLKKYKWIPLWGIFASLTFSRTPILFYVTIASLYLCFKILGNKVRWVALLVLTGVLMQPLIFFLIYKFANPEIFKSLEAVTTRIYLQPLYFQMFLDHPFGVGLGQAYGKFEQYRQIAKPYLMNELDLKIIESNEQHSLSLQILSEVGLFGYLSFAVFVIRFFFKIFKSRMLESLVFVSFMTMTMVLNSLYEIGLYLVISTILNDARGHSCSNEKTVV